MNDEKEEYTPVVPPDNAQPVSPIEVAKEEANSKVWNDEDILQHVSTIVQRKLETSRDEDFAVSLSYSELRLIADAVNMAINRTASGNQMVKVFQQRADAVKVLSSRILEVIDVQVK